MSSHLTHLTAQGEAHMVDVGEKPSSQRVAVARGHLKVNLHTLTLLQRGETPKGDALAVARVAGIMAAKSTHQLIPLCHQLALTSVKVEITPHLERARLDIEARVSCVGQTGVEMEALTAVSVCALTLYDMLKAVDHEMTIEGVTLVEKRGGKRDLVMEPHGGPVSSHEPLLNVPTPLNPQAVTPEPTSEPTSGLIPAPSRGFKVVPKGPKPPVGHEQEGAERLSPSLTPLLSPVPQGEGASEGAQLRATLAELGEAEGSSEGDLLSSCPAPLTPAALLSPQRSRGRSEPAQEPAQEQADELTSDSSGEAWEESILHDGSLDEGEGEGEGLSNPPALSQAARDMAKGVRQVPLDDAQLKSFVLSRPLETAYLLGYLTPEYEASCRAFIYESEQFRGATEGTTEGTTEGASGGAKVESAKVEALLFEYTGLSVPAVWTFGGTLEVEAIIAHVYSKLSRQIYITLEDHHLQAVRTHYMVRHRKPTLMMGLKKSYFVKTGSREGVVPLSHKDTGGIMRLYQQYPDHLFEPAQLDTGLYRGVKDEEGQLISVAGVHFLNPSLNIAVIGNIVTDSAIRGKGLATRCIGALLDELFERVDHVALNVTEDNMAAIACYEKFGFRTTSRIIEARARLR